MKRSLAIAIAIVMVLIGAAACQSATPTAAPAATAAPTNLPPTMVVLPTFTPVPLTDPALAEFKKQLADAFASNDPDKLRNTVSFSRWVASIYREGGTMPIDPMRGLKLTQQFIEENDLTLDPERNTYEPTWSKNDANTSLFVLVTPKKGDEPYAAHLLISKEPSAWRYTGIVTRIPYYDAPSVAQLRANAAKYDGKEFMYVGTYEGKTNASADAGAAPNENAFLINTLSGPLWVTMIDAAYTMPLPADLDAQKGKPVRVIGNVRVKDGVPYLEADSVALVPPSEYGEAKGTIQSVDEQARTVTLASGGTGAQTLYLSAASYVGLPDGSRGKFSDLKAGQSIEAFGVPQADGRLRVEQIFITQ